MIRLPPPAIMGNKRAQVRSISRSADSRAVNETSLGTMSRQMERLQIPPFRVGISTIGGGDCIGGANRFIIGRGRIGVEVI